MRTVCRLALLGLVGLFVTSYGPGQALAQEDLKSNPVRFAVIGDRTGSPVEGIYGQVLTEITRLRPEFIITVGDMIEGPITDTAVMTERWEEYMSLVAPLTVPIYYTPGNNDIELDVMLPHYEKYIGRPYYSFDHRGLHFVVLDNSRWNEVDQFPSEQIEWVTKDLQQNSSAAYTLVLFHQPYWYRTIADNKPDTLHSIFRTFGVDAVFSGHFHRYFSGMFDGIKYTCIGSSGGGADPGYTGLLYHYAWVTVDDQDIHIAPVRMDGVLPWDEFTVGELRMVNKLRADGLSFSGLVKVNDDLTVTDRRLEVTVHNLSDGLPYDDSLIWDLPESWTVEPLQVHAQVPASDSASASFLFNCSGDLYPLPTLTTSMAYADGRSVDIDKELMVARQVNCVRLEATPVIDGVLSEECWQTPYTRLLGPEGKPHEIDSVAVSFACDEKNLYWAVYCHESVMDSLHADLTERDAPVYSEDCFGVMLSPDATQGIGYQFYINPVETIYDQRFERQSDGYWVADNSWNADLEVAAQRGEDFWTLEVRLPLAQLELEPQPGHQWRVQFRRKQFRLNSWAGWQIPWQYDANGYGLLNLE